MQKKPVLIIGGGLAGIAAARKCISKKIPYVLLEKENRPGGLCRTEKVNDFYFDYTGHLIHFQNDLFSDLVKNIMRDNLGKRYRNAWIFSNETYTRYPFQVNLFGLPVDVIVECVYEYSKCCFSEGKKEINNFEDWILNRFGNGIAEHFMIPYNKKIFKKHPRELSQEITGRFVPGTNLKATIKGALIDSKDAVGYNSEFYYPVRGGIEALVKELIMGIEIKTGESVDFVNINEKWVHTSCGRKIDYQAMISTQPIPKLVNSINIVPEEIKKENEKLHWVSVLNVNHGVKNLKNDKHWIYFPEEKYIFHRIGCTHNFSDNMAPKGYGSIYIEISYDNIMGINITESIKDSVSQLIKAKVITNEKDIEVTNVIDIPYGYVLFENDTSASVNKIISFLSGNSIFTAGRFGSWKYSSMEDAFIDGWNTADKVADICKNKHE